MAGGKRGGGAGKLRKGLSAREKALKQNILTSVQKMSEPKNHYTSQLLTTLAFTGDIDNLFNPAQGTTAQTRIGDKCLMTQLSLRGRVVSNLASGAVNTIRVIVFYWKVDTAERTPNMDDILQATYAGASWTPYSPIVVGQEAKDLQIISDRTYDVNQDSNAQVSFHINKRLNKQVFFNDNATTGMNQLYVMFVSDDGAVAYPQFEYVCNVQFRDLL